MWKETEHFSSCRVKKHPNSTQVGLISCGNHPFLKVGHTKKSFFPSFHFGVGKQLCAGREHPALTWVDSTVPGSEGHRFLPPPAKWDLFMIFFPHCSCSFLFPALATIPRTGWCETSQLHPSRAPAPQLVALWVPQPPMDPFRTELWGQGTPLGLTRGALRDVFPPGFEHEALPANAAIQF